MKRLSYKSVQQIADEYNVFERNLFENEIY